MSGIIEKATGTINETKESLSGAIIEIKNIIPDISGIKNDTVKEISETISIGEKYLNIVLEYLGNFWPKLVGAILVLWIGFKIINFLNKFITKSLEKTKIDPMVKAFSISFISILLKIMVFLSAAGMLGVQTTSFLALFTAAGVAIGMSLSGTLQNFAGGMIILIFKLYKIGDFVSVGGNEGTVKGIYIFHTIIITVDRKTVIIPNSQITNGIMINFSTESIRRQDINFGIDYDSDIDKALKVFKELAEKNEKIIKDEKENLNISVFVSNLEDSSVLITIRFFVKNEDLVSVRQSIFYDILKTCKENNIKIPFPTREIFINNNENNLEK